MRPRRVTIGPFPASRKLVVQAVQAGRHQSPMHGLMDVDVTEARHRLAQHDPPLSFTAYVVACVGRAAAAHPSVHAYRNWRGRIVQHHYVDVATMVEVAVDDGAFPMAHLVSDADVRSVADVSAELRAAKAVPGETLSGSLLYRMAPVGARLPGLWRAVYALLRRSVRMRRMAGTVSVTSVGMFGGGGGFGIGVPTIMSLGVLVGGISERPWVVGGVVVARDVLDLTVTIDHKVVDGAPAARFGADLRHLIESAELVS